MVGGIEIVIEPLGEDHSRGAFTCGHGDIDAFVTQRCLDEHKQYKVRIHVACAPGCGDVLGFYSLVVGAMEGVRPRYFRRKFSNRRAIPTIYLAGLAVTAEHQRSGIGTRLMLDMFEKAASIANVAGASCLTLDAVDEEKAAWYAKLGFERYEKEGDKIAMYLPIGTLLQVLNGGAHA